jgi:hypothetical protein
MHQIKPTHTLTRAELRDLAYAAADRGDPLHECNLCEPGTTEALNFELDYLERRLSFVEE